MAIEFEKHLFDRLNQEFDEESARHYRSVYEETRGKLATDVFTAIQGAQPNLTDHSKKHIENVMHNAGRLISNEHATHQLTGINLYCLAMFILFHDVGNLFGRKDHHKHVGRVYDWARGKDAALKRERTLVIKAAMAHTGRAMDRTTDTLKELNEEDHLDDQLVRLRDLAAILRFADELAEGPQRTSEFLRLNDGYDSESRIHHDYASITHVHIDRPNGRICLTYEIETAPRHNETDTARDQRLRELLKYAYDRVTKLDQERRYARFYCRILNPFNMTAVEMNFHHDGGLLDVIVPSVQLDDKGVPGESARPLHEIEPSYEIESLLSKISSASAEVRES